MKNRLLLACVLYTVFVIYGSLVPWQYNGLSFGQGWRRFQQIPYLDLGIASRADWVANILLFVPLTFGWLGWWSYQRSQAARIVATPLVWLAGLGLCLGIEFTQVFFPPRTVSINDVVAESFGGAVGLAVWWRWGERLMSWLVAWQLRYQGVTPYLQLYLAGLFGYSVLPLDLTLSPVEFYHKWHEDRIILLPFGGLTGDWLKNVYDILADVALWVPVPWLWAKLTPMTPRQILWRVFWSALAIEGFQLFVYSRVTDVTDIGLAVVGGGLGLRLLGRRGWQSAAGLHGDTLARRLTLYGRLGYVSWGLLLIATLWYPYDFRFERQALLGWESRFFSVPLRAYYYGTEYRAITEVFHKLLFFVPVGGFCRVMFVALAKRPRRWVSGLAIAVVALVVESGQMFIPGKNSDMTDLLLEIGGGLLGFLVTGRILAEFYEDSRLVLGDPPSVLAESPNAVAKGRSTNGGWWPMLLGVSVTWAALTWVSQYPGTPYNVREWFSADFPALSAFGLTVLFFWCFGGPLAFLLNALGRGAGMGFCPKVLALHGLGAWLMVRLCLPLESLHDIVGSPILPVNADLELAVRFLGLFGVFSILQQGGNHLALLPLARSGHFARLFVVGGVWAAVVLPLGFWIVVDRAATDNLTELLPNGGYAWAVLNIGIYWFLVSWLSSSLAVSAVFFKIKRFSVVLAAFLVSFEVGYRLVNWGTEQYVLKYDQVFSTLQFLLSSDRAHLTPIAELRGRFYPLHAGVVALGFFAQYAMAVMFRDRMQQNYSPPKRRNLFNGR
ncbi:MULTISPECIES: VanZ family protein [Methylomonas]|uniref:VanZ-like domain-containing protein n=1 Tax=Methylomonas koyamae TaxID=702114 RepID=A0A177N203_9GAMM|nr:VanZ family protein [Methylomonas koyamae]OAI11871.1 hypothetical protein A1355_15365 [Methylomonas koyamae]